MSTTMASNSEDDTFVSLLSKQESLMKEMNAYLAAISASPGEETTCSIETRRADNRSMFDSSVPLSDRLKVPSCSDTSTDNDTREGLDARRVPVSSSRKNSALNAIDEDGDHISSAQQYEYFNDFDRRHSSHGDKFEEDSLLAMAKRMDAASIVSDPSMIVGPSEKFLALPQPKKLMKKLGLKLQANKPPPPPRNNNAKGSPKSPQGRLSQKMKIAQKSGSPTPTPNKLNEQSINSQKTGMPISLPFNTETDEVSNLSETNHTGESSTSIDSPASTKEIICFQPENSVSSDGQGNDEKCKRASSLESEKSFETDHVEEVVPEQHHATEKIAARAKTHKGSRRKPSSKKSSTTKDNEGKKSRSGTKKKQTRRTSPRLSTSPIDQRPVGSNDSMNYLPTNLKQPVSTDEVMEAIRKSTKKKSSRRDPGKQKRKKDRKKRQQKQQSDSDDEPMTGVGFNTRIKGKKDDIKANIHMVPEQMQNQCEDAQPSRESNTPTPQRADSMQGMGFNTRIRDNSSEDAKPNVQEQMPKQSQGDPQSPKKSRHVPSQDTSNSAERQTYQYESCSEGETSGYSSDDQTQFYYESTDDDEFTDSDDDIMAVGTSVEDAVNDLNNKRALTKVKNLFGIRG